MANHNINKKSTEFSFEIIKLMEISRIARNATVLQLLQTYKAHKWTQLYKFSEINLEPLSTIYNLM